MPTKLTGSFPSGRDLTDWGAVHANLDVFAKAITCRSPDQAELSISFRGDQYHVSYTPYARMSWLLQPFSKFNCWLKGRDAHVSAFAVCKTEMRVGTFFSIAGVVVHGIQMAYYSVRDTLDQNKHRHMGYVAFEARDTAMTRILQACLGGSAANLHAAL